MSPYNEGFMGDIMATAVNNYLNEKLHEFMPGREFPSPDIACQIRKTVEKVQKCEDSRPLVMVNRNTRIMIETAAAWAKDKLLIIESPYVPDNQMWHITDPKMRKELIGYAGKYFGEENTP